MKAEGNKEGEDKLPEPIWRLSRERRFAERGSRPRLRFAGSYPELRYLEDRYYPDALGPELKERHLSKYKYTSVDTLNLLDTPNEISSPSGTLGTFNPKDHPPQFPAMSYKRLITSVHLEDARDERLHRHPSRLRKLSVELAREIEKCNFYNGEVRWYLKNAHRQSPLMLENINEVMTQTAQIMHSIDFKQVTDEIHSNLSLNLERVRKEGVPGTTNRYKQKNCEHAKITVDPTPRAVLKEVDHPMKEGPPEGFNYPPGPSLYLEGGKGHLDGIFKTNLNSTADYFAPPNDINLFDNYSTRFKSTLYHEMLHVFWVEHARAHKSSGEWTQDFYEHPISPKAPPIAGGIDGKREHPMLSFNSDGSVKPHEHGYLTKDTIYPFAISIEPSQMQTLTRQIRAKQPWGVEPEIYEHLHSEDVGHGTVDKQVLASLNDYYAQTNISKRPPHRGRKQK